jgi:hypothetical protein
LGEQFELLHVPLIVLFHASLHFAATRSCRRGPSNEFEQKFSIAFAGVARWMITKLGEKSAYAG